MKRPNIHPLNAEGDFFVEYDMCMACDAPRSVAPELIDYDENGHCYFKCQPQTPEEVEHAIYAVGVSCVEAVRYKGNDSEILKRIGTTPCFNRIKESPSFWRRLAAFFRLI